MTHPFRFDQAIDGRENWQTVAFPGKELNAHSFDFNDMVRLLGHQSRGIGDALMADGHIKTGGGIAVDSDAATISIEAAEIYIAGYVYSPSAAIFAIALDQVVNVGVCLSETIITPADLADLKGQIPGTRGQTQPGADRTAVSAAWVEASQCAGTFYPVFTIDHGVIITNTPPVELDPITSMLAKYDREANGHYIVNGWRVTAMGKTGNDQHFSIGHGVIDVWGNKLTRDASQRLIVPEAPILERVESEPHIAVGGTEAIPFNHTPVSVMVNVTVTREVTETITRGQTPDGSDPLGETSVAQIVSVVQGGTTYVAGDDYQLTADQVDWSAGGDEPATGSTYDVVYRYIDTFVPDGADWDENEMALSGAVAGSTVLLEYDWALPRTDVIVVDRNGALTYVEGLSVRHDPLAPSIPNDVIKLCEVQNVWTGMPVIVNTATKSIHYNRLESLLGMFYGLTDLVAQLQLQINATSRERTESRGVFTDPFFDDDMRDQGVAQTLAVVDEQLVLPSAVLVDVFLLGETKLLDWTEEVIIDQPLSTGSTLINPYAAYDPLPATVTLTPPVDMWVVRETEWSSSVTRTVNGGTRQGGGSELTENVQELGARTEDAEFLREIDITVSVQGFGAGEILDVITLDGVDVTPVEPQTADGSGDLSFVITIPNGIPAGSKEVIVTGQGATKGFAIFIGSGVIETRILRRVFTTQIFRDIQRDNDSGGGGGNGGDPQAQTWTLPIEGGGRMVSSVNVKFPAIGATSNPVICQIRETSTGFPNSIVVAETTLSMGSITLDEWTNLPFTNPVYLEDGTEYSLVFITDDDAHELMIADLGGFDTINQQWVTSQAYTIGERLSSSNASTWTPHPKSDLTFQINAAIFAPLTKIVPVGTVTLVNCSDLIVDAPFEEPGLGTSVAVKVTMADATIYRMRFGQPLRFDEFKNEDVTIELELVGTPTVSPVVYPFVQVLQAEMAITGDYQSRAVPAGADSAVRVTFEAKLPGSSSAVVEIGDGSSWETLSGPETVGHEDGYTEYRYLKSNYDLVDCRVRISENGSPTYRPSVRGLRMNVTPDPAQIV